MKKIISFFAASALALGLIGCSGDLHENDVQPLALTGITGTEVVPLTLDKADGSEQSITFKIAPDTKLKGMTGKDMEIKDGWKQGAEDGGYSPSKIQFKIVPTTALNDKNEPDWSMDFGGKDDPNPIYLSPASEEYTKLYKRGSDGVTSPGNIILSGVVANEEYTLKVKYTASTNDVSVKIVGASVDASEIKFVINGTSKNFPATKTLKDGTKKDLSYALSKSGSIYSYSFVSNCDETLNFHFVNDLTGALGRSSIPEKTTDDKGNVTNTDRLTAADDTDMTLAVYTGKEYKISVDVSAGISKALVYYEVIDLIKDGKVNGNFIYLDNFYSSNVKKDYMKFKAKNTSLEFYLERASGGIFGLDENKTVGVNESADLKYVVDTLDEYGEVKKPASEIAKKLKVTGLTVGKYYKIQFTRDNLWFNCSVKVIECPDVDLENTKFIIAGTMNSWPEDSSETVVPFTVNADGVSYSTTFKATATSHEFAIHEDGNWDYKFCDGVALELGVQSVCDNDGGNAKIEGLTIGSTYKMTITTGPDELNVIIEEVK